MIFETIQAYLCARLRKATHFPARLTHGSNSCSASNDIVSQSSIAQDTLQCILVFLKHVLFFIGLFITAEVGPLETSALTGQVKFSSLYVKEMLR